MISRMSKTISWALAAAAIGLFLVVDPAWGRVQETTEPTPTPRGEEHQGIVPDTPEQHLEKAEQYKRKAAAFRQEADDHRAMLANYRKRVASNPKDVLENPWLKKMRVHCEKYIKEAEAQAREADKFAEYHRFRAAELRGQ